MDHPTHQPSSPAEAVDALLAYVEPVGTEVVALAQAAGRVLGETIVADRDSPACDVSAMDGYAVRIAEARSGALPILADARIGTARVDLPAGGAARIVTGAPVPLGADAVIKREDTREHPDRVEFEAAALQSLRAGEAIRRRGENVRRGTQVLAPGNVIDGPRAGVLSSVGAARVRVFGQVRVGVLVTGDELVPAEHTREEWQLRDSNGPALAAMLGSLAYVSLGSRRHAADDLEGTTGAIADAAGTADVLFITGGVSMGNRDYVPEALRRLGARTLFHKIPQRPGRPILCAVLPSGVPVMALPGNPVSVLATARRIGVPAVRRRAGIQAAPDRPARVLLTPADEKRADLWWYRPVRLLGGGAASLVSTMGSGDIMNVGSSDGFVEVPPGQAGAGPWDFYPWRP